MLKYSWDSFVSKVPIEIFFNIKKFNMWRGDFFAPLQEPVDLVSWTKCILFNFLNKKNGYKKFYKKYIHRPLHHQ